MTGQRNIGGGAAGDGVIVEFHRVGNAVKVSAVDTRTYEEVSIVAPVTSSEREMTDAVLRKLAWVQAKKGGAGTGPGGPKAGTGPGGPKAGTGPGGPKGGRPRR